MKNTKNNLHHTRRNANKAIKKAVSVKNSKSPTLKILITLFIAAALFLTLNDLFFKIDGIPTWKELYKGAGLTENIPLVEGETQIHFVDVGQGDCELIKTKNMAVLIDCGEREYYTDVIDYIKNQNIERLDYVIATHPHSDHIGGMSYILDEFDIGTLIMPEVQNSILPSTNTYKRLLEAVKNNNITVEYAEAGKSYTLDDSLMTLLSPVADYNDLNNYSAAVKFTHGENSFLFTGDMEKEAETDILNSGADVSAAVLKVAHHGSTTSSQKKFLTAVSPEYAVIEAGASNDYGHPHEETLKRLNDMSVVIYRTDLYGNIVFLSSGSELEILTEKKP